MDENNNIANNNTAVLFMTFFLLIEYLRFCFQDMLWKHFGLVFSLIIWTCIKLLDKQSYFKHQPLTNFSENYIFILSTPWNLYTVLEKFTPL